MTPTEIMMNGVDWQSVDVIERDRGSDLPYVTHQGVLRLGDAELRCYQLNDGRRIFDAEDIEQFFGVGPNATEFSRAAQAKNEADAA